MKRSIILLSFLFVQLLPMAAQSVSPAIVEFKYKKEIKGSVTIENNAVIPLTYTLEGMSFTIDKQGRSSWRSLDNTIHLTLEESSGKLRPRESRTIFYRATCEIVPCWFAINTTFNGLHTPEGFVVSLHLDQAVYACPKEKNCRATVRQEVFGITKQ